MFTRILLPTDGSQAARLASGAGIEFARQVHADIVGLFVAPLSHYPIYLESLPPTYLSDDEYRSSMKTAGETFLGQMRNAAQAADLKFLGDVTFADDTAAEILRTARRHACDLIFMGSHGQGGGAQLLPGSVTLKVLAGSHLPVMVYRQAEGEGKSG
ncbi:universal stress protein [Noviherbaspirillum galbum]|uniref:Universal stress protein n=1 Tax=Noviherbaspirillum galbum TaxID=2709383 RepID=A0A6B3SQ63_9BURK|nr:universal stress protein [Noviherbaspirillum galbum]NEX62897.1 universal stress protein [Noviherbaspirillum galbum]